MKLKLTIRFAFLLLSTLILTNPVFGERRIGKVANTMDELQQRNTTFQTINVFEQDPAQLNENVSRTLRNFTLLKINQPSLGIILSARPEHISLRIPVQNNSSGVEVLLYRADISPNGFTLETSGGERFSELNSIVHYRGIIKGDNHSVVSISFSNEETMGLICNDDGNFVLGKMEQSNADEYVFYNDKDLVTPLSYTCGTNTIAGVSPTNEHLQNLPPGTLSVNCVNWYYETDYDIFVGKGSLANVNSYIQGIFNQVSTLYDNDGISITLQTLFVWTTADPYTGPSTSNYLSQFGAYRTSFAGDLANLVGYAGGGGVAYVNGLCSSNSAYKMAYSGISSSYQNVPTYSWTVEVITHEDGHLLGSRHTHDCVWNGNSTRIDNCGPQAGYSSGSCAAGPMPSSGTIMSYCHLVGGVGINFNNGFGPQPTALMLNKVNTSSCLSACSSCPTPPQPGTISGANSYCQSTSQSYSVTPVGGATSYLWSLPPGWTGSSTTNSINVTTSGSGGTVSVIAVNSCGNSTARTLTVTGNTAPSQPGNISGSTTVCQGASQVYSVSAVTGATSYTWTLPSGWSGTSTTNSITVTTGSSSGTLSVRSNNACGSSSNRSVSVTVTNIPAQPLSISGQTAVCQNISYNYSVPAVAGATSYTWTLPSGWTGTSTSNNISAVAGNQGGTISVSATNGCGTSDIRSIATNIVTAPSRPQSIATVGGNVKVCPGDVKTYFISPVPNSTSYTWTPPPGGVITGGQGTTSVTVTYNSGFVAHDSIKVVAYNGCAVSDVRFLRIFRDTPGKPSVINGPPSNACNTTSINYSVNSVPGINYNWTFSQNGATIISGQGTSSIMVDFSSATTAGILSVTGNNSCGTSTSRTKSISPNPSQPSPINGTTTPCANQQGVPYSISPVPGATHYTWKVPAGSRINDGSITSTNATLVTTSPSVTINFKNTPGNVRVSATNTCGTGPNRLLAVTFGCRMETNEEVEVFSTEVFPNPVSDVLNIQFESDENTTHFVRLTDLTGKTISTINGISNEGENSIEMDVRDTAPGIYFIEVMNGTSRHITKVVVQ